MGVNKCDLCKFPARIHCESDQASLCWECDAKVHGANFLVARHSRCLLCRSCQSPTPWRAEGSRLGATVSVCQLCAATSSGSVEGSGEGGGCSTRCVEDLAKEEEEGGSGDSDEEEEEEDMEEEDEESESGKEEDEIDEGENQVVPWSPTPPPVASSSSSGYEEEEESDRTAGNSGGFLKRMRENADLVVSQSQDDLAFSSDPVASTTAAAAADEIQSFSPPFGSFRDRKRAAHSLPSPAPPSANATTATLLGIRVGNGNHRPGY